MIHRSLPVLALSLLAAVPCVAQGQDAVPPRTAGTPTMPGMDMGRAQAAPGVNSPKGGGQRKKRLGPSATRPTTADTDAGGAKLGDMNGMGMSSSIDLNDPMSQEASGTAWLPASTPMFGKMFMQPNGDMLMVHGAAMPRYTDVGSKRGDRRFDAPNWAMAMYGHPLGAKDQVGLRAMVSLDPITEGGYGYPLLYQTGESWHHQPLHDRQHPHDLVDELAVSYSHLMGGGKSAYLYLGYPGEPALGPPTYMHRLIAYDLADAPIGHHWQDATHITFGVATAGLNLGSKVKLEASDFTGREPDENRYSFDKPRFDSYSGRLSFNPDPNNALQVSYGFVKNAEGDGANQHRITASWLYNRPLGEDANFTTTLVWGQNNLETEGKSNSYLAEADYQHGKDTLFTRIENIQKSGNELQLPAPLDTAHKYTVGEYTLGYVRDLKHGTGIDTGVGIAVTADTKPSGLDSVYGTGTPVSFQVFFRFRPSRMKNMNMGGGMAGMDMGSGNPATPPAQPMQGMPGMATGQPSAPAAPAALPQAPAAPPNPTPAPTAPTAAPITVGDISATISPSQPKARVKNPLTLTITGADGKPLVGATVKASVAMTSMDMGTSHPAFNDLGDGRYRGQVQFSMAGQWRVTVTVTPPGGGAPVTKALDYAVVR